MPSDPDETELLPWADSSDVDQEGSRPEVVRELPTTLEPPTFEALETQIAEVWGFHELRPLQAEAMRATLDGRDALVVLPTGGGKSLCYQAPALVMPGLTLVVSPLIALMQDQLDALLQNGVSAGVLTSAQDAEERRDTLTRIAHGDLDILFCSPERLVQGNFYQQLLECGLSAVAVDEAHCISHWGHDFRPEYRMLGELRKHAKRVPLIALTATATPRVQDDIVDELQLDDPLRLIGNFDRPNLTYRMVPRAELKRQVLSVIERHAGHAGICYTLRRKDAESLARDLARAGIRCQPYHAGLTAAERRKTQNDFQSERIDVVVATVAFGMGIDRSDVRFVVHANLPKGVEQYSQETGRAGRDGLPAECVMFYSGSDYHGWRALMERSAAEAEEAGYAGARPELEQSLARLSELWGFAGGTTCRHRFLVEHFGGEYEAQPEGCGACDVCLGELDAVEDDDSQVIAQKILSCVVHTNQRFGAGHVTDVLRGARTKRITELGHDRVSTFGLLSECSKQEVRSYIDQLVAKEHLAVASGKYPTLALTRTGVDVMHAEESIQFFKPVGTKPKPRARAKPKPRTRRARAAAPKEATTGLASDSPAIDAEPDALPAPAAPILDDPDLDDELVERLRALRRKLARERGVPPYILFNDRTLVDLAQRRPTNEAELLEVDGIGAKKAADLGEMLIEIIAEA